VADEIDQAKGAEEQFLSFALGYRKESGPAESGFCLNCEISIVEGRWCGPDCRDEWEDDQRRLNRLNLDSLQ
jgi:hypothetical protein